MNETMVQNFIEQTEKYLNANRHQLDASDRERVTELYHDLMLELERQQAYHELYD